MQHIPKFILLICILLLVAGCKLAVVVVEGGGVRSDSSGTCIAGTICIVEVSDTNFSETFTALPDSGWYFQKWNSGENFFCGGSNAPTCVLSFEGHEESEAATEMVNSSETFYLMPVFREISPFIEVDGKLWAQPSLFKNVLWSEIAAICPLPSGVCAGELNGIDLNGWTWASIADVNKLFNHYIGSDVLGPGPDELFDSSDSTWGAAFYSDGWIATGELVFPESRGILGWLRNKKNPELAYAARISDSIPGAWYPAPGDWDTPDPFDLVSTANVDPVDERRDHGGWFYSLL